jgi:predicted Zn-dependent peptidase
VPETLAQEVLANGLRVVVLPRSELPLVAINLWYHVGSKNEAPGRTGFAHLFEHMLFQGSAHVGTNEHFHYVQQAGGVANGSTWYDRTNYYETLPSSHLELGLWLESDRMGFLLPAMTGDKLENQRSVVLNERRQRIDNQPYGRASERVHELLYPPTHPYHWPVIGYQSDIAAASLDDVASFFETYYRPNNAVLTLVGDCAPRRVFDQVQRYFGDLPAGSPQPAVIAPALEVASRHERIEDPLARLPRAYIAFAVPRYGEEAWYAASLLALILTGGKSTRLYRELVYREEIAQSVSAYVYPTELCATFLVAATGRPGVDPGQLVEAILGHLELLAAEGPREDEVQRARDSVLTDFHSQLQSYETLADAISAGATLFDRPDFPFEEPLSYQRIAAARIQAVAREALCRDRATIVEVVPAADRVAAETTGGEAPAAAPATLLATDTWRAPEGS